MFTGLIEATAAVLENGEGRLTLERPSTFDDLHIGSSICVSGACLSVVSFDDRLMQFDVSDETLKWTKLGNLREGDRINLERALRADERLGGHIVQGHVDEVGEVMKVMKEAKGVRIEIQHSSSLCGLIVPKGSITLDGVSLTVVNVTKNTFSVALIPQTLGMTTLGSLREGDRVNLEVDILGKYVQSLILPTSP